MARRKLVEVEAARAALDAAVAQEAIKEGVSLPASNRVVAEVAVRGATRLLTVDVSAVHSLPEMGTCTLAGAMVRLRPVDLCTVEDMDYAEQWVRKAGALTVSRMPLPVAGPDADVAGEAPPDDELAVLPMIEALDAQLDRLLARDGCDERECADTKRLAHRMLEQAGG